MNVVDIPIDRLQEASWNPNVMDEGMKGRLRESIRRYGVVENLVVRPVQDGMYEVVGGNQRLQVLREMGINEVSCVVVELDDGHARLLAQALNRVEGVDDLGLKAELVRDMLESIPQADILSVLPESEESLRELSKLCEADLAEHLKAWERAQAARLRHFNAQLSAGQLEVVEEALELALSWSTTGEGNPNRRGNALVAICRSYLQQVGDGP